MFGLAHCSFFHCLMNESCSIPEAERQPLFLCPVCLRKMCKALKFDIQTRYSAMLEQLKRLSTELHDTCHCAAREAKDNGEEEEGVVCEVGGEHCATLKDCNGAVASKEKHSAVADCREEKLTNITCEEQGAMGVAQPNDGVMQEKDSSSSTCDCQLEQMRRATKWLELQLSIHES